MRKVKVILKLIFSSVILAIIFIVYNTPPIDPRNGQQIDVYSSNNGSNQSLSVQQYVDSLNIGSKNSLSVQQYDDSSNDFSNQSLSVQQYNENSRVNQSLVQNQIFINTKYYSLEWNDIFTGEPIFKNNRCIYTNNPTLLASSSVVVFHLRDIKRPSDLPTIKPENQKWIVFNIETPIVNHRYDPYLLYRKISPQFDLAMTYRLDSDIPVPYGRIVRNANRSNVDIEINFSGKSKGIAWFVSNCNSLSKREIVVKKIRKLIPVDVYGYCGNLTCAIVSDRFYKNESCYEMLSKDYKFYLSFENSICTDYVTEKLFNILNYDVIPVVYGGANYSNILPFNSYIDVMNFTSAEELVSYLQYVGNDERIYRSYFEWRKDFHVVTDFPDRLCDFVLSESMVTAKKRMDFR